MSLVVLDSDTRLDRAALLRRPRVGMNISSLLPNTLHNIPETLTRFVDAGVELTDVNFMQALWPGTNCLPFTIPQAGQPFDLFDWNAQFFERAHEIRETFNAQGIVVQGTLWDTYSWASRHVGRPGIPDGNVGPWRHNVNGIKLGGAYNGDRREDDETLTTLIPTPWDGPFLRKILPFWDASINPIRLGNEMPEKKLHERLRDVIRSIDPKALVIVNRQDDTPGQADNMDIGTAYDFIEIHGATVKSIPDLRAEWPKTKSHVKSYQAMLNDPAIDNWRITFSSDGARTGPGKDGPTDPYDWVRLGAFFRAVHRQGCSVLHQSRAKMTLAPNHHMIETDWFQSLTQGVTMPAKKAKKKNPTDATMRNVRATNGKLAKATGTLGALEARVAAIEQSLRCPSSYLLDGATRLCCVKLNGHADLHQGATGQTWDTASAE